MSTLVDCWYRKAPWLWLLWPLSLLFCTLVRLRRLAYRLGLRHTTRLPVPLIVVGNITVGGSGKTPMVLWLAAFLRRQGYRPGLVSRGYGGQAECWPQVVTAESDPAQVGDEAVLLTRRSGCPMVVGPDRVAAAERLLAEYAVDILISDDGMQHYRLGRDIEIAVIDGDRRLGNGLCLPAGPLREPHSRLKSVDFVVANGAARAGEWAMHLGGGEAVSLQDGSRRALSGFPPGVHAAAGIGHPARFFQSLRRQGLSPTPHPFADHHAYTRGELDFADGRPVLMTEKDAVKYAPYATSQHWFVPVSATLSEPFGSRLLTALEKLDG
ncbi:MAG: tetraacyldisaccharide 4'-kinase [Pseudomonadota bacterium]